MAIKGMKGSILRWLGWVLCLFGVGAVVFNVTLLATADGGTAISFMLIYISSTLAFLSMNIEMELIDKYQKMIYAVLLAVNVFLAVLLVGGFSWVALIFLVNLVCFTMALKLETDAFEKNRKTIVATFVVVNAVLDVVVLVLDPTHLLTFLVYLGGAVALILGWGKLLSIFWKDKQRCFLGVALFEAVAWVYGILLVLGGALWLVLFAPILVLAGLLLTLLMERKMIKQKLLVYIKS